MVNKFHSNFERQVVLALGSFILWKDQN